MDARPPEEPAARYWRSFEDIALYDQVFAARISWKWSAALDEIERRGGMPSPRTVLDWGVGTGAATRTVLRRLAKPPEKVTLFDRDKGVLEFALRSLREEFEGTEFEGVTSAPNFDVDLALASHVLDELDAHGESILKGAFRRAESVLWVEPGSKRTSRRLTAARDTLTDSFEVVAPCTHRETCGMLTEDHDRDWCHHFAKPPAEVHTTGEWSEIGRELKIDLRSLPYSFLALRRAPVEHEAGLMRRLGRVRLQRGRALVDVCDAGGVREQLILQRSNKALLKEFKKSPEAGRLLRETDGTYDVVL